jgi:hypothetical protein
MTDSITANPCTAGHDDWCIEEDTRHAVVARRNVLAALWAGNLIGKRGAELERYAREVHSADYELPGDADVVAKLSCDLTAAGFHEEAASVRSRLASFQKQAWRESVATD